MGKHLVSRTLGGRTFLVGGSEMVAFRVDQRDRITVPGSPRPTAARQVPRALLTHGSQPREEPSQQPHESGPRPISQSGDLSLAWT